MLKYKKYEIEVVKDNMIRICNVETGNKKNVKICYANDFVFQVRKGKLMSCYNAKELLEQFQKWIDSDFEDCYINAVCREYVE